MTNTRVAARLIHAPWLARWTASCSASEPAPAALTPFLRVATAARPPIKKSWARAARARVRAAAARGSEGVANEGGGGRMCIEEPMIQTGEDAVRSEGEVRRT